MYAQVDQKNESILVPIYGLMVPFHILAVKNAVNSQEGDHSYIRINFNFGPTYEPGAKFPQAIFLKELSYRTSDNRHAAKVCPLCPLCPLPAHCLSFVTWRGFLCCAAPHQSSKPGQRRAAWERCTCLVVDAKRCTRLACLSWSDSHDL